MHRTQYIKGFLANLLVIGATGIAQAVPDWEQVNTNGFVGPQADEVTALEAFDGYLYAGNHNPIDPEPLFDGAQIFRSPDGVNWTAVTQPGFGTAHDNAAPAILDFVVFNSRLYASTGRGNAAQIWRSLNGTIWAPMTITGFSDPDSVDIAALAVYGGMIYAGVRNEVSGAQIWRSFSGENNTWTKVAPVTPGTADASVTGLAEFDGALYATVESESPAQVWQSYSGASGTWVTLVSDGFGDAETLAIGGMAVFGGYLYVGAGNDATGALLYRTSDGATWDQVITPGFGDPDSQQIDMVYVFQNKLYVSTRNPVTGIEIWRSADGGSWEQANSSGFGDSNNTGTNKRNATGEFMNQLYVGTSNVAQGGQLWRKADETVLPGDTDADGDVDLDDYTVFAACLAGPNVTPSPTAPPSVATCLAAFDAEADGDVDAQDFASFQLRFTGPSGIMRHRK